jgi:hypothetical protein
MMIKSSLLARVVSDNKDELQQADNRAEEESWVVAKNSNRFV